MFECLFRLYDLGYGIDRGKYADGFDLPKVKEMAEKGDGNKSVALGYYYYSMASLYSLYDPKTVAKGAAECLHYFLLGAKQGNTEEMTYLAGIFDDFADTEKCDWLGLGKALGEGTITGTPVEDMANIPKYYPVLNENYSGQVYREKLNEYAAELSFDYYRTLAIKGNVTGMLTIAPKYEKQVDYHKTDTWWYGTSHQSNYEMARQ